MRNTLTHWNRAVFGNIFEKKFRCLARLNGAQKALQQRPSCRLETLEFSLKRELDDILAKEELYWKKKSSVSLLKEGERNTRFFHTTTIIRRHKNHITRIKLDGGNWCEDQRVLKEAARDFFVKLYTAEPCLPCDSTTWAFPPLSHWDKHLLNRPMAAQEVHDAVFQMGAYKAPGPDGFPPCMF